MVASPVALQKETLDEPVGVEETVDASLSGRLARMRRDVASIRATAIHASPASRAEVACTMLRLADALTAAAVGLLPEGSLEESCGLPADMVLGLQGRRMGSEARMITRSAAQLRSMPRLSDALSDGMVSWGQVRAIVSSVSRVPAAGRAAVDQLIDDNAASLAQADPDCLVRLVDETVAEQRADLAAAREDRQIERSFLAVQGRLDGSASIYGEADAQSTATIVEALDAIADAPQCGETGGMSRAQQRFEALVAMCEASLNGESGSTRPRPRVLATIDVSAPPDVAHTDVMSVLWPLAGRPARLTSVASESLLCDASVVPVLFDRGRPVAVGDASSTITGKVRTALIARDGGCRFPGCGAPAAWCDVHLRLNQSLQHLLDDDQQQQEVGLCQPSNIGARRVSNV
jgi:hypothetical protein